METSARSYAPLAWLLALVPAIPAALADTPAPKITVLHTFDLTDGAFPAAELLEVADGVFYGSTSAGGPKGGGTIFRITASGEISTVFAFGQNMTAFEGEAPAAPLIRGADGFLYGTTSRGGDIGAVTAGGYGTIFRLTESGTLTTLHTFTGPDGQSLLAPLLLASDGSYYSTTYTGGSGGGTVFRMTPAGDVTTLYSFAIDASDGTQILSLVEGPDHALYGSTRAGGSNGTPNAGGGTVFRITLQGKLTTLHYFNYGDQTGQVVFGNDGALYGITQNGQQVFRLTTTGDFTPVYRFTCSCSTPEGAYPTGRLLLGSDGRFYGANNGGGLNNKGALYAITTDGVVTPLHSFDGTDGNGPTGGLIEGRRDGRFYGTTYGLFRPGYGTVFKLTLVPPAPTGVSAVASQGRVSLSWSAPRSADTYDVFQGTMPRAEGATPILTGVSGTSVDVNGLTNGTTYYFTVAASNEAGRGNSSVEVSGTQTAPPPTPPPSGSSQDGGGGGGGAFDWLSVVLLTLLARRRVICASTAGQR